MSGANISRSHREASFIKCKGFSLDTRARVCYTVLSKLALQGRGMDIRDRVRLSSLLTEYGALLTERQRDMLAMYVEMDMSLFEVAEETGVTRQAVLDAVRHGADSFQKYEDAVGKVALKDSILSELNKLTVSDEALRERLGAVYALLEG